MCFSGWLGFCQNALSLWTSTVQHLNSWFKVSSAGFFWFNWVLKWLSMWSAGLSEEVAAISREAATSVPLYIRLASTLQLSNVKGAFMCCEAPPHTSLLQPFHMRFSPCVMASLRQIESLMYKTHLKTEGRMCNTQKFSCTPCMQLFNNLLWRLGALVVMSLDMNSYNETWRLLLDFSCEIIVLIFLLKAGRFLSLLNTDARRKEAIGVNGRKQEKKFCHIEIVCHIICLLLCEGLTKPCLKCAEERERL